MLQAINTFVYRHPLRLFAYICIYLHIFALDYLDLEKDLECPGRALLEPTPVFTTRDVPKTCRVHLSHHRGPPRLDLAEVELTEEEVKMLTVNIIHEAGWF